MNWIQKIFGKKKYLAQAKGESSPKQAASPLKNIPDVDLSKAAVSGDELDNWTKIETERLGCFTASPAHRLTAGIDATEEDKILALASASLKPDLITQAEKLQLDSSGTKEDLARRIYPKIKDQIPALSKGAYTYIEENIVELQTGGPLEFFENDDTLRGHRLEEEAVKWFQVKTGVKVENYGQSQKFHRHPDKELKDHVGCTPDGEAAREYGFEGKAPRKLTHWRYLKGTIDGSQLPLTKETIKEVEPKYYWQIIHGLLVRPDYKGWYFMSYNPEFLDENKRSLIFLITREDVKQDLKKYDRQVRIAVREKKKFLKEIK